MLICEARVAITVQSRPSWLIWLGVGRGGGGGGEGRGWKGGYVRVTYFNKLFK